MQHSTFTSWFGFNEEENGTHQLVSFSIQVTGELQQVDTGHSFIELQIDEIKKYIP